MSAGKNAAPVIIKRKKVSGGGGHHGGAWKVAYADFVTAMMAFFLLMWLLNATTEKQRKGLADYFNPSVPISRASGGGDGAFGGESMFSEEQVARMGLGASQQVPSQEQKARGDTPSEAATQDEPLKKVESLLQGFGGESMMTENLARHVVTKLTDEGLIIEIFDTEDSPLFLADTAEPDPVLRELSGIIAKAFGLVTNKVAVQGHLRSLPEVLRVDPSWDLSTARAQQMRRLLEGGGLAGPRIARVTGMADRKPVTSNPMAVRNNRLELILLRSDGF